MNWVNLIITIVSLLVTVIASYYLYRRSAEARDEKIRSARREVKNAMTKEFASSKGDVNLQVVESLLSNKYRDCKVDSLTVTELPMIIDDLITSFTENLFISSTKKEELTNKALRLKDSFEKRKANLEEAVDNWKQLSILRITLKIASTVFGGVAAGLTIIIIAAISDPTLWTNIVQIFWISGFIVVLFGSQEFRTLKGRREKSSYYLHEVLENNAIEAMRKLVPNAVLRQNVRVGAEGNIAEVDLMLTDGDDVLPVEIKHGLIRNTAIEHVAKVMELMNSNRGLLITTSKLGSKIKELSRQKGVIVVDNVNAASDIVDRLKLTTLFQ